MNELFSKIDPQKLDRILNSSFKEFSKEGFQHASTNTIVKNAEISKGLLFHYFGNKQHLYQMLIEFSLDYITELLEKEINWEEQDFFKRVEGITILKLSAMKKYPHIYDFLKKASENVSLEEIKQDFSPDLINMIQKIYTKNIDYSLFRSDIDLNKTIEIIQWTIEGAIKKIWKDASDNIKTEDIFNEHREYMNILRTLVYK